MHRQLRPQSQIGWNFNSKADEGVIAGQIAAVQLLLHMGAIRPAITANIAHGAFSIKVFSIIQNEIQACEDAKL